MLLGIVPEENVKQKWDRNIGRMPLGRMRDNYYKRLWEKLCGLAKGATHPKLLDIGCSDGTLSMMFGRECSAQQVHGTDIVAASVEAAKAQGVMAELINTDERPLPYHDGTFDAVLCNQVLEHVAHPDRLIGEIRRVLAQGGTLYISVPNLCALHNRLFVLLGWQPTTIPVSEIFTYGNPLVKEEPIFEGSRHINGFSPMALRDMLKHNGFEITAYRGLGIYPLPLFLAGPIGRLFPGLCVYQLVKARKR
jgi:2-polyprenyl-3-methyl-5-hydroxy-6-metoxy-1,4-benzoquinol methylase